MIVITADQRGSRRGEDLVDAALHELGGLPAAARLALPFERTVGDEVQGVLIDPADAVDVVLHMQRLGEWSVGVGVGSGALADTARASSGQAFVHAREAVERAKSKASPVPIALSGDDAERAREAEALLRLLAAVVRRRGVQGWEVVDRFRAGAATGREIARDLGISPQAVSARRRAAMWDEEKGVRPLAARLLAELDAPGDAERA